MNATKRGPKPAPLCFSIILRFLNKAHCISIELGYSEDVLQVMPVHFQ